MHEGASGGPVLLNFDWRSGVGTVVSIHSVGRDDDMFGFPQLNFEASQLFDLARAVQIS